MAAISEAEEMLMHAASSGQTAKVKQIIEETGVDVNFREQRHGKTSLMLSARNGHIETVKLLIEKGAKVNVGAKFGSSALTYSAKNGHLQVVELLIKAGAEYGWTALMFSARHIKKDVAEQLIRSGGDVNIKNNDSGETALMLVAGALTLSVQKSQDRKHFVELLLKAGADVNIVDKYGETALMKAAAMGIANITSSNLKIADLLINAGAKVNHRDSDGETALMKSAKSGDLSMIRLLIKSGARVNIKSNLEDTAVMKAALGGHIEVIKVLIKHGADAKQIKEEDVHKRFQAIQLNAIQDALKNGDKCEYRRAKLMIVGKGRAGKTSTLRSLFGQRFNFGEKSTKGIETKACERVILDQGDVKNWRKVNLEGEEVCHGDLKQQARTIIQNRLSKRPDTPLDEGYTASVTQVALSSDQKVSVNNNLSVDMTEPETQVPELLSASLEQVTSISKIADKQDFTDTEARLDIDDDEIIRKFPDLDFVFEGDDSDDKVMFTVWDFGGQEVFYTLHHVFLTESGLYVLAFNMCDILAGEPSCDMAVSNIQFWLSSIQLHAPSAPILLVGTHYDKIYGNALSSFVPGMKKKKNKQMFELLSKIDTVLMEKVMIKNVEKQICWNKQENSTFSFFPLDNTGRVAGAKANQVKRIHEKIEFLLHNSNKRERAFFNLDILANPVSLSWVYLLDLLASRASKARKPHMKKSEVRTTTNQLGISHEETEKILNYFHTLGVIVYFASNPILEDLIIFQPQWILDAFSTVIHEPKMHHFKSNIDRGLYEDYDRFMQSGILSKGLLEELWKKSNHDSEFEYLVTLMEEMLLLCPYEKSGSQMLMYFVPSILSTIDNSTITGLKEPESKIPVGPHNFCLKFSKLPNGVFERLICYLIIKSMKYDEYEKPRLNRCRSYIKFGKDIEVQILLQQSKNQIDFSIIKGGTQHGLDIVKSIRDILDENINNTFMNNGLKWELVLFAAGSSKNALELKAFLYNLERYQNRANCNNINELQCTRQSEMLGHWCQNISHSNAFDKRDQVLARMDDRLRKLDQMVKQQIEGECKIPTLFILRKSKKIMHKLSFWDSYYMIPVCEFDLNPVEGCGPEGKGYHITLNPEFMKNWKAVYVAVFLWKALVICAKCAEPSADPSKLIESMKKVLHLDGTIVDEEMTNLIKEKGTEVVQRAFAQDYKCLQKIFEKGDPYLLNLKLRRTVGNHSGRVGWVRDENCDSWASKY